MEQLYGHILEMREDGFEVIGVWRSQTPVNRLDPIGLHGFVFMKLRNASQDSPHTSYVRLDWGTYGVNIVGPEEKEAALRHTNVVTELIWAAAALLTMAWCATTLSFIAASRTRFFMEGTPVVLAVAAMAFVLHLHRQWFHVYRDTIAILAVLVAMEFLFHFGQKVYDNLFVLLAFGVAAPLMVYFRMHAPVGFMVLAAPLQLIFGRPQILTALLVATAVLGTAFLVAVELSLCFKYSWRETSKVGGMLLWALFMIWLLSLDLELVNEIEAGLILVVALAMLVSTCREGSYFRTEAGRYTLVDQPQGSMDHLAQHVDRLLSEDKRYDLVSFNCNHFANSVCETILGNRGPNSSTSNTLSENSDCIHEDGLPSVLSTTCTCTTAGNGTSIALGSSKHSASVSEALASLGASPSDALDV
jgi:hypothetical protein